MDTKFNQRLNWYKNQLSPFGQKVLQTLCEQWHCGTDKVEISCNTAVKRQRQKLNGSQHKKVLSFRDSNSYSTVNTVNKMLQSGYSLINNTPPLELIECEIASDNARNMLDHLVDSDVVDLNNAKEIIKESNNNKCCELDVTAISPVPGTFGVSDDITWNDMFDTELFLDEPLPRKSNQIIEKESKLLSNIENNKENSKCQPKVTNESIDLIPEISSLAKYFKEPNTKPTKRKNQLKVADENNKKNQKISNSLRKEKYNKTVKNWLNDVDKNMNNIIALPEINTQSTYKSSVKKGVNHCKAQEKKKVVQAQLANKGGVMKFEKPKTNIKEIKNREENRAAININTESLKETTKGKNNRTKFIAPIKSQIPVKDIKYNVITLDNSNVDNYIELLTIRNKIDVPVVIVYRNGFCQLNSYYTEETCVPEGILVNLNKEFFYIETFEGRLKEIISEILESNIILCYDGKIILMYLSQFFECRPFIMDLKIGGALIDSENLPENFSDLQKLLSYSPQYTIATDCNLQKVAWYTILLKESVSLLKEILVEKSLWNIFVEIEMPLVLVIADMEKRGVSIDLEKLKTMEEVLLAKMMCVEEQCHIAAGKTFQINSHPQVRALLYDDLQLDEKSNVRVKETITTGAKSTSETALRSLMSLHSLPKLILEYRHLHKAYATFLTGISQHVKDGVVRSTWVQIASATGRIACNNPNMQAIPKAPFNLVMFPDSPDIECQPLWFRSVYAARRGCSLLAADFRQVECRIFAFAAADATLLDLLHQDGDIFRALSAQWIKKSESEVSEAERERTKRVVYASLYGAGARKLADMLGQTYDQTLTILASFNRTFPSLKAFGQRIISACEREQGVVRSLGGRARTLRDICSEDGATRAHAQRRAVNYVVQGSAADLCKTAMILTEERLRLTVPALDAHLLLQIHDELVWEVADDDLHRTADIIKEVMEGCGTRCGLPLRLPVAVTAGKDWAHMDPLHHHP